MRLLLVIDRLSPHGAQRQIVLLARELRRRGHAVELFAYYPGEFFADELAAAEIPVHRHVKRGRMSSRTVLALRRLIQQGGFELIYSRLPAPNAYAIAACRLLPRRPVVVVAEGTSANNALYGRRHQLIEQSYRLADFVVVNSHHRREDYAQRYRWLSGRLETIWNGVDLDHFHPAPVPSYTGRLRLMAVGRVAPMKNCRCLVEALAVLRDRRRLRPIVNWIGSHRQDVLPCDADYVREVDAAVERLDLASQWQWTEPCDDLAALYREHHALIHPSYVEGLPNVVCEALACGRAVVAADTLDHPLLVQHEATGLLFDWRSPESLADALAELHRLEQSQWDAMSHAARRFAEQELSASLYADRFEALFARLIAARSG